MLDSGNPYLVLYEGAASLRIGSPEIGGSQLRSLQP
jgi:hypothetical protein